MRHKYETPGIILSRVPVGETAIVVTILTPELGVVYARAQGARRSGAKLAASLVTFAESNLTLVRGAEHWRVTGAVFGEHWFLRIQNVTARERAARVCGLLLRLVAGETLDANLFRIMHSFFEALATLAEDRHEAVEILAVIRLLAALGLDAGKMESDLSAFTSEVLTEIERDRAKYVMRINRGIESSGL